MGGDGGRGNVKRKREIDCKANESQERKGDRNCEIGRGEKGKEDKHVRWKKARSGSGEDEDVR